MAEKVIVGTFDPKTGQVKIEAIGFKGKGCEKAMQSYEKAVLAEGTGEVVLKEEYGRSASSSGEQETTKA